MCIKDGVTSVLSRTFCYWEQYQIFICGNYCVPSWKLYYHLQNAQSIETIPEEAVTITIMVDGYRQLSVTADRLKAN